MAKLTAVASRSARGILKWGKRKLASEAGLSLDTIYRFEKSDKLSAKTEAKIKDAFSRHNVKIINTPGTGAVLLPPKQ